MSATTPAHGQAPYYFVPAPSSHPAVVALGLFFVILGASQWINGVAWGKFSLLLGVGIWLVTLFRWFGDAIRESESGQYSARIDTSYRWSMAWFIFSEVMFFAAFFGALYWTRQHSLPNLGDAENQLLWPGFQALWPAVGNTATGSPAGTVEAFHAMGPWPIPTLNTGLLLTSGVTLTIAHHALLANQRNKCIFWMWTTVVLGLIFLGFQAYEYMHAYSELNLKLSSGVYGSTFYLLTGFHGFHVFVGVLMLSSITLRLGRGHFSPERHFGFEGAAWYWHFVDVVWLGLYVVVYWL
jgi:cytochrome c oxidase subunit 3